VSTQFKFLLGAGGFGVVVGVVYWYFGYEPAGFLMLTFMGVAAGFYGGFILWKAGRERRTFSEDDPEADPAKQVGETVGWFSSGSIWPLVMGLGAALALQGFVYGLWLFFFGAILFVWAVIGLMMESRG
jgi:cytochrome c oxidase subunit IV